MQVESLVGRADIASVALGDQHMLLLDHEGGVWACGENKEGQCGLGTPLEVIAAQHRRSFYESMRPSSSSHVWSRVGQQHASHPHAHHAAGGSAPSASGAHGAEEAGAAFSRHLRALLQEHTPGPRPSAHPSYPSAASSRRLAADGAWSAGGSRGRGASWHQHAWDGGSGTSHDGMRMALLPGFGGMDMEGLTSSAGMQPGHHATPMRLGRDQHPLSEMFAPSAGPGACTVCHKQAWK